jgi:outer membrane protein assembly factor BamB
MIIASTDQSLYGVSVGGIEWRVRTSAPLVDQHAAHKNRVYVNTSDWGFACFEASSGKRIWGTKDVGGAPIGIRNGMLLVWDKGTIVRLDAARGDVIDRTPMPTVRSVMMDAFEDGNMFVISETGLVTRLNPRQ